MIRQQFLAAGAAGVAASTIAAPAAAAPPPVLAFDRVAFEKILNRPFAHRQVFASTALGNGIVLHYMENSLAAYEHGFNEGPGTVHAAAVLYGTSLSLACDDTIWSKYHLAALLAGMKTNPETIKDAESKNPFAARVAALQTAGASFFVCNNALRGLTGSISEKSGTGDVYADVVAHLLPGVMVVPAGVAALNAAQEARFTYIQASLA